MAGAEFAPALETQRFARVFRKGTDREIDSYSGFFDNGQRKATGLGDYLAERSVDEIFLLGLATDYCVRATALDARKLGHTTHVILDACRGVELSPGNTNAACTEMRAAGCRLVTSEVLSF